MNPDEDRQKRIAKFIDLNHHTFGGDINVVCSIVSDKEIGDDIARVVGLLKKDTKTIEYNGEENRGEFFREWAKGLVEGKLVVVDVRVWPIDSIWYDQLMQFKENNRFYPLDFGEGSKEWLMKDISPKSGLFLVVKAEKGADLGERFSELSDYMLDLRD